MGSPKQIHGRAQRGMAKKNSSLGLPSSAAADLSTSGFYVRAARTSGGGNPTRAMEKGIVYQDARTREQGDTSSSGQRRCW